MKSTLPGLGFVVPGSVVPESNADGVPVMIPTGAPTRTLRNELSRRLRVGSFDLTATESGWEGTVTLLLDRERIGVRLGVDRRRDPRKEDAAERLGWCYVVAQNLGEAAEAVAAWLRNKEERLSRRGCSSPVRPPSLL